MSETPMLLRKATTDNIISGSYSSATDPNYAAESAARETQLDRRAFWKQAMLRTIVYIDRPDGEKCVTCLPEHADRILDAYDERVKDGRL